MKHESPNKNAQEEKIATEILADLKKRKSEFFDVSPKPSKFSVFRIEDGAMKPIGYADKLPEKATKMLLTLNT